jgi:hypothetical protein
MRKRFRNINEVRLEILRMMDRSDKRRRPRGGAPALVEPPRGPLPLQGGAEAPLEFDN